MITLLATANLEDDKGYTTYFIEQSPHRQDIFINHKLINLPMPWLYYVAYTTPYGRRYSSGAYKIMWSRQRVNNINDNLYTIPLPNTGLAGYTCCPPFLVNKFEKPELIKHIIHGFWDQNFHYWERVCSAHALLHDWAEVEKPPWAINLEVYKKWSQLKIKDLSEVEWTQAASYRLSHFLSSTALLESVQKRLCRRHGS